MSEAGKSIRTGSGTAAAKRALRRDLLRRRDALTVEERSSASESIRHRLAQLSVLAGVRDIAAFWPIRSEVDLKPLLADWTLTGKRVALPVMMSDGLVFRLWHPGNDMRRQTFGVLEPEGGSEEIIPDALLVPLVGFDRVGNRLGYGKGYYDRAIAGIRDVKSIMTIGIAFAMQERACIPAEPHDQPLDLIVTEAGVVHGDPSGTA